MRSAECRIPVQVLLGENSAFLIPHSALFFPPTMVTLMEDQTMQGEIFIIDCPRCGKVEAYAPTEEDDQERGLCDDETAVEEQNLITRSGHVAHRVQCPQCGQWIEADQTHAE